LVKAVGITRLIVVVNKMDDCGWSKDRYDNIVAKLDKFIKRINFDNVMYLPVSAYQNINILSDNVPSDKFEKRNLISAISKFHDDSITDVSEQLLLNDTTQAAGVKVDFRALFVPNIIATGFDCICHLNGEELNSMMILPKTERFIKTDYKGTIFLEFNRSVQCRNGDRVIVRFNNFTIGFGRITGIKQK